MLLSLFSHYKVNMDDIVTNLFLKLILTFLLYSFIYCPFFWLSYSIECGPGRYGYNCNQSCDGCLSDSCDKGDGVCTNTTGYKPGRQLGQPLKCDKGMQINSYSLIFIYSLLKKLFEKLLVFQQWERIGSSI